MQIERIVPTIPYECDPFPPFRYSPDAIAGLEAAIGRPFPDDVRWYLANVGWRRIGAGQCTVLVRRGEALLALEFEAVEHEVFAVGRYETFVEGREGGFLPHNRELYMPLGQLTGGGNPSVALRLLLNLNDEDHGSIWAVRTVGFLDDGNPSPPIRIADDLASFLAKIGPDDRLRPQAEKVEEALFERLLVQHLASAATPTTAADPRTLVALVLDRPSEVVLDGARNVEYAHRANGLRVETAAEFAAVAAGWTTAAAARLDSASPPPVLREAKIGEPQPFDRLYAFNGRAHGYALVTVESVVDGDGRLREEYLLHRGEAGWTMVRRYAAAMADRHVKGLGTFAFDETHGWTLKKKVRPAWSNLSFAVHVEGDEGALTPSRIAFVRDAIGHAAFRPAFEDHVFRLYTGMILPEFEAMPDEERAEWAASHPTVSGPGEVWTMLRRGVLHIESDDAFHLQADAPWDPEHGLTVRVSDWRILS